MKTLSIAISTLALFASNLVSQVTVTRVPDGKGGYVMEYKVCPPGPIKDFHLQLHDGRLTKKFDANVHPVRNPTDPATGKEMQGWNSAKKGSKRELVWTSKTGTAKCIIFKVTVTVNSAVKNFDDVFWVTTKRGKAKACDFHVLSLRGKINGQGQAIPGWRMVQRGRMISWYIEDCTKARETQSFSVIVPNGARLNKAVWFATNTGVPKSGRPGLRSEQIIDLGTKTSGVVKSDVLIAYHNNSLDVTPLKFSRIGEHTPIDVTVPMHCGRGFFLAASLGIDRGIRLPSGVLFPLDNDFMLVTSMTTPSIFQGFQGVIPQSGSTTAQINIPPLPFLIGLDLFVAGLLDDFRTVSEPAAVHITM